MRIPSLLRPALILAIAARSGLPIPATATPAPGADLGVASGIKILDSTSCGQYMTTEALDSQCTAASTNHYIILGWNFNPNACSAPPCAKPDGFNIVRRVNGSTSVFTTQAASPTQTTVFGTILQNITGDNNVGACFSVEPYRGTSDVGRASNEVCIGEVAHLGATRWGTGHSHYEYDSTCDSPNSNPAGYQLMFMNNGANSGSGIFAGFVNRENFNCFQGTYNRYSDFYQALLYYDLSKFAGKKVSRATLELHVVAGAYNIGAKTTASNTNGNEQRMSLNCATNIGFPTVVNVGSDPAFPQSATVGAVNFMAFTKDSSDVDLDITGMVRAWLNPGGINRGIVLSPSILSDYNLSMQGVGQTFSLINQECLSQYSVPTLDITFQ